MEKNYYKLDNNEEHKIMKHYIDIGTYLIKFFASKNLKQIILINFLSFYNFYFYFFI